MSSLRDPCAATGLATHAAQVNPSIAARITFFVAPNLFFTLAMFSSRPVARVKFGHQLPLRF
jgi:hypothetical protein